MRQKYWDVRSRLCLTSGQNGVNHVKMQSTVIEELAAELDGKVKFGKVNVDEEASLALNYQIMSIPTLVVMHYGLFQGKAIGVQGKDAIREMLQGVL